MSEMVHAGNGSVVTYAPPRALMPVVGVEVLVARRKAIREAMDAVMEEGVHFGKIPGTDKRTLLKAGAEEMCTLFGLTPRFIPAQFEEDFTGERHGGEAFFGFVSRCQLWQGDWMVAEAQGSCNSWEKKYRWRSADRACPSCSKANIMRSKFPPRDDPDAEPGYYCNLKTGGCGANFGAQDQRILGQLLGMRPNPDIADLHNTIIKMSDKRALVAATLIATGASAIFTQDIEDNDHISEPAHQSQSGNGHATGNNGQSQQAQRPANSQSNQTNPNNQQPVQQRAAVPTGTTADAEKAWIAACTESGMPDDPQARLVLFASLLTEHFQVLDPKHNGVKPVSSLKPNASQYMIACEMLRKRSTEKTPDVEPVTETSTAEKSGSDPDVKKSLCPVPDCKSPHEFECGCTQEAVDQALRDEAAARLSGTQKLEPVAA